MRFNKLKTTLKNSLLDTTEFLRAFICWAFIAILIGVVCAVFGAAFFVGIDEVTKLRTQHPVIIYFLPLAGLLIVFLYRVSGMIQHKGTDNIICAVRGEDKVSLKTAPLIFVSTIITHMFGGSAGREGAALQLGGSIGYKIAELFKLCQKNTSIVIMCGMSAFFSALFGTPLTAAIFAIEVVSVGIMQYSALIPCTISAITSYSLVKMIGIHYEAYDFVIAPSFSLMCTLQVVLIAILCAVVSIIFCVSLHSGSSAMKKIFKNEYVRIFIGGLIIVILTLLVGNNDYNGTGAHIIDAATRGSATPYAFILKIIFTAITISAGFKGGEIVPSFFVGATFGCFISGIIGLDPGFGAAVGMICMFCAMLNCPLASIILSVELFGDGGIIFFAVAVAISYMLSGYYGLYHGQKIVYSKTQARFININTR